jgi:hypothetical protein
VPRSNTSQSDTANRSRSRGPARLSTQESVTADAAADMSSSTQSVNGEPSYDEIAEAAYERYLQRGGTDGQDFDDWLEAERELKSRRSS